MKPVVMFSGSALGRPEHSLGTLQEPSFGERTARWNSCRPGSCCHVTVEEEEDSAVPGSPPLRTCCEVSSTCRAREEAAAAGLPLPLPAAAEETAARSQTEFILKAAPSRPFPLIRQLHASPPHGAPAADHPVARDSAGQTAEPERGTSKRLRARRYKQSESRCLGSHY
ncbi:hypothetical protein AOLI_G00232100 [Acnodon oligacanthus]